MAWRWLLATLVASVAAASVVPPARSTCGTRQGAWSAVVSGRSWSASCAAVLIDDRHLVGAAACLQRLLQPQRGAILRTKFDRQDPSEHYASEAVGRMGRLWVLALDRPAPSTAAPICSLDASLLPANDSCLSTMAASADWESAPRCDGVRTEGALLTWRDGARGVTYLLGVLDGGAFLSALAARQTPHKGESSACPAALALCGRRLRCQMSKHTGQDQNKHLHQKPLRLVADAGAADGEVDCHVQAQDATLRCSGLAGLEGDAQTLLCPLSTSCPTEGGFAPDLDAVNSGGWLLALSAAEAEAICHERAPTADSASEPIQFESGKPSEAEARLPRGRPRSGRQTEMLGACGADANNCTPIPNGMCSQTERGVVRCACLKGFRLVVGMRTCVAERTAAGQNVSEDCVTVSSEACVFPFLHEGRLRHECVKTNSSGEGRFSAFCATAVDPRTREALSLAECSPKCPLMKYHSHEELLAQLGRLASRHKEHARLFDIGRSKDGRPIVGIRVAKNLDNGTALLRPRVKLVGNMHGNEPVGREMLIYLAQHLLEAEHRNDSEAANLFRNVEVWILPTMNPDGFKRGTEGQCSGGSYAAGRLNEGDVDLNRDFPTWWDWKERESGADVDIFEDRQVETQLMMKWILDANYTWALSANFHDGAVLVNYPWDNYMDSGQTDGVFRTPDHDVFYHVATTYSHKHKGMQDTTRACPRWGQFKDGVTNGADWYPIFGGMQDFNYLFSGTLEVTVELSCCKFPHRSRLLEEWELNRASLLAFVALARTGVKGRVVDDAGRAVAGARVRVRDKAADAWRDSYVRTDADGAYYRLLVPGQYDVQAFASTLVPGKGRVVTAESDVRQVTVFEGTEAEAVQLVLPRADRPH